MCCFSGPVEEVSQTRIFARPLANGRQFLAYQMRLNALRDVAMILPIPVPRDGVRSPKDVEFVKLDQAPHFFDTLDDLYPRWKSAAPPTLDVESVGAYEASYVPTQADFPRIDKRFQLSPEVWKQLPVVADFGFVVFQLRKGEHGYHPMAFHFPRRDPARVFFPTVHIHDGEVHPTANFDHRLYLQKNGDTPKLGPAWTESKSLPTLKWDELKVGGLVARETHVYRAEIRGERKNVDIYI